MCSTAFVPDGSAWGGKARNLRYLAEADFPVPPWIVIPSTVSLSKLVPRIRRFMSECRGKGWTRFIVRSSAEGEDEEHSHAGQFESVPNRRTVSEILNGIAHCRRSACADHVAVYRRSVGLSRTATVATIVQAQVDVRTSGVAFTDDRGGVVEVTWGFGEALLQGWVSPDRYHINDEALSLAEIGRKHFAVVPLPKGELTVGDLIYALWPWGRGYAKIVAVDRSRNMVVVLVPHSARVSGALDLGCVRQLSDLLARIHRLLGRATDVEFVVDRANRIWIVQARQVTRPIPPQSPNKVLIGSGGCASGPVRVVRDPSEVKKVSPGDVLVVPMSTPSLMSAILRAAAIISEESGLLCHTAIVARELGKPCLLNAPGICEQLRDGEYVTVDADCGEWRREPGPRSNTVRQDQPHAVWLFAEHEDDIDGSMDVYVRAEDLARKPKLRRAIAEARCRVWVDMRESSSRQLQVKQLRVQFGNLLRTIGPRSADFCIAPISDGKEAVVRAHVGDPKWGVALWIVPNRK